MDKGKQQHRQHHHHHDHHQHQHQHQQQQQLQRADASSSTAAVLDSSNTESYPDLHVVFEFFTDNPQKTMPTETTSPLKDSPYFDPYWDAIRSMQTNENFLEGILLRCVDCTSRYPFIHYTVYKNGATSTSLTAATAAAAAATTTTPTTTTTTTTATTTTQPAVNGASGRTARESQHKNSRVRNHVHKQIVEITKSYGSYKELHTFIGRHTTLLPKRPSNPNTAYIVSAFMTSGNLDSLDKTWSYWSGADFIVENMPASLKLERITFHKVVVAGSAAASQDDERQGCFSYVLLCELGEAMADLNRAREFIDHLKFRQCGISSLYVIDHFF